jgi:hypothetical protein
MSCQDCAHWQNHWTIRGDDPPADEIDQWGECWRIGLGYGGPTPVLAFTQDASDYKAVLHTRGDFGCVLHAPGPALHCADCGRPEIAGWHHADDLPERPDERWWGPDGYHDYRPPEATP